MTSRVRLGELFARGRVGTLLAHRLARASGVTGGVTKALCVLTTVRFAVRRVGTLLAWGGEVPCTFFVASGTGHLGGFGRCRGRCHEDVGGGSTPSLVRLAHRRHTDSGSGEVSREVSRGRLVSVPTGSDARGLVGTPSAHPWVYRSF